jgi:hypothetical protein
MNGRKAKLIRKYAREVCDPARTRVTHTTIHKRRQIFPEVDMSLMMALGAPHTVRYVEGSYQRLCRDFKKQAA